MLLFSGCSKQAGVDRNEGEHVLHYSLVLGSGGGFAGTSEGYIIDSTGVVTSWRGTTLAMSTRKEIGTLDADTKADLQKLIEDKKLLDTQYGTSGNLTSFLLLQSQTARHTISWLGDAPGEEVPLNVRESYAAVRKCIDRVVRQQPQ